VRGTWLYLALAKAPAADRGRRAYGGRFLGGCFVLPSGQRER